MFLFFFLNDTATTEIYTLSLHDALPIYRACQAGAGEDWPGESRGRGRRLRRPPAEGIPGLRRRLCQARDRKSTRLNSSHVEISYAVFCLKKKKKKQTKRRNTRQEKIVCK